MERAPESLKLAGKIPTAQMANFWLCSDLLCGYRVKLGCRS